MKEVHFGYENSMNPIGSHEGMGVGAGVTGPIAGEYLGVVKLMSENYLITRVTQTFKSDEDKISKIDVRRALADIYPDCSGVLYIDQEQNNECNQLIELLNSETTKKLLDKGVDFQEICCGNIPDFSFECVTRGRTIPVTAIKHEVFETKRELLSRCHSTFSDMQKELDEQYAKSSSPRL